MAQPRPLSAQIRRRRILAVLAVAVVVALAVGFTVGAVRHTATPAPTTTSAAPTPPPRPFRIVFPEGFTRLQMAERVKAVAAIAEQERHQRVRLDEAAYLAALRGSVVPCLGNARQTNLEGMLFPATYDFLRGTTARRLVREQFTTFCARLQKVDLAYARSKNLTPYDVVTIASMIEREAKAPRERPLIAAVIYNRLHNRMPLGIDATLRYGLHIPPTESITKSQLASNNPYNTRRRPGLPPTPIANPGLASLQAAAHPAGVDYLYFVRKPDHVHHFFTASAAAFERYLDAHGYG